AIAVDEGDAAASDQRVPEVPRGVPVLGEEEYLRPAQFTVQQRDEPVELGIARADAVEQCGDVCSIRGGIRAETLDVEPGRQRHERDLLEDELREVAVAAGGVERAMVARPKESSAVESVQERVVAAQLPSQARPACGQAR